MQRAGRSARADSDGAKPRLSVTGLTKSYAAPVLRDVRLRIRPGRIHGLVGENGAGKTTLARVIAGLTQPDAGSMELDGAPWRPRNPADALDGGIAFCAQELSLIDDLSVADNLALHGATSGFRRIRRRHAAARARRWLDLVGLSRIGPQALVGSLSLAERQLVEVARALAADCRMLILDEPTSALTVMQSERLHAILKRKARAGCSVVYISHRLGDVLALCDEVSVLRDGEVVATRASTAWDERGIIRAMVGEESTAVDARRGGYDGALALAVDSLRSSELTHPVSFSCRRGEILGLFGLDGSGRTELLTALFGLGRRVRGKITYPDGRVAAPPDVRQAMAAGVGLVTEDRARTGVFANQDLGFNVTIADLESVASRAGRLRRPVEATTAQRLLGSLGVRYRDVTQRLGELSGGNQQKLLLARWLQRTPRLLLLDEPTRGVDVAAARAIHEQLLRRRDAGMAIVAASSELPELQRICDRILVLSNRRLVAEFRPDVASSQDILRAAFAGFAGQRPATPAGGATA